MVLCLLAGSAIATTIQRNPQENEKDFVARNIPNDVSEVVHVASASVWSLDKPAIVAFYQYPVSYADKNKNYGDSPNEYEVLGVIFVPVNLTEYAEFEIDSYGPEGGNAEIDAVFFAKADKSSDKKLVVMVSWHTNNGVLHRTYIYEKPQLNSNEGKLVYLQQLSQPFGLECDSCPYGDHPRQPAKYKTAAAVKAELRKLVK
jgi:hypothetical protein